MSKESGLEEEAISRYMLDPVFHYRVELALEMARLDQPHGLQYHTRAAMFALLLAERSLEGEVTE